MYADLTGFQSSAATKVSANCAGTLYSDPPDPATLSPLTGFDPDEIAAYTVETTEGLTDEDEAPAVPELALTEPGELWTLGKHVYRKPRALSQNLRIRVSDGLS